MPATFTISLVIVRDMWLASCECPPCLHTMYVDKRMRG